jgi:hypothetical protein
MKAVQGFTFYLYSELYEALQGAKDSKSAATALEYLVIHRVNTLAVEPGDVIIIDFANIVKTDYISLISDRKLARLERVLKPYLTERQIIVYFDRSPNEAANIILRGRTVQPASAELDEVLTAQTTV